MNRQDAKDARRREPDADLDALARDVGCAALEVHRLVGPGFWSLCMKKLSKSSLGCAESRTRGRQALPCGTRDGRYSNGRKG